MIYTTEEEKNLDTPADTGLERQTFVSKPFHPDELVHVVGTMLG